MPGSSRNFSGDDTPVIFIWDSYGSVSVLESAQKVTI